jgi:hypothetical protein
MNDEHVCDASCGVEVARFDAKGAAEAVRMDLVEADMATARPEARAIWDLLGRLEAEGDANSIAQVMAAMQARWFPDEGIRLQTFEKMQELVTERGEGTTGVILMRHAGDRLLGGMLVSWPDGQEPKDSPALAESMLMNELGRLVTRVAKQAMGEESDPAPAKN